MATTKTLNTRIQLKYDSYENWMKDTSVELLKGEIAICTISTAENDSAEAKDKIQNPPTVLFKVGPGKFKDLKWASALAADVHDWAKLSYADFLTELQKTVYTETEVNNLIAAAEGRAATDAKNKADAAEANAKAHAESQASAAQSAAISAAAGDATSKANQALADAKTYTDEEINKIVTGSGYATTNYVDGKVAGEAEARAKAITDEHTLISAEIDADVKVATDAIAAMDEAYKAADEGLGTRIKALEDISHDFADADAALKSDLEGQIATAKQEVSGEVTALANGAVKTNTDAITKLNGNSTVEGSVDKKISDALNDFMSKETADDIVNTYKELIDYAAEHGQEAIDMAADIKELQDSLKAEGETGLAIAEAKQAGLDAQSAVETLAGKVYEKTEVYTKAEADAAFMDATETGNAIDAKISALDLANTYQAKGNYQPAGNYKTVQEAVAEVGAADKTLKISQDANGVITATPVAIAIEQSQVNGLADALAAKANDADLAAIAKTGNVNDLVQGENEVLVFNCGNALEVF